LGRPTPRDTETAGVQKVTAMSGKMIDAGSADLTEATFGDIAMT